MFLLCKATLHGPRIMTTFLPQLTQQTIRARHIGQEDHFAGTRYMVLECTSNGCCLQSVIVERLQRISVDNNRRNLVFPRS